MNKLFFVIFSLISSKYTQDKISTYKADPDKTELTQQLLYYRKEYGLRRYYFWSHRYGPKEIDWPNEKCKTKEHDKFMEIEFIFLPENGYFGKERSKKRQAIIELINQNPNQEISDDFSKCVKLDRKIYCKTIIS